MEYQETKVVGGVEIANDIQQKIKTTGVRGLDFEKAKELGVFQRMGCLLSVCHSSVLAAYRIYGEMDYLVDELRARKNEIAKEMNLYDKAFDRFVKFWTTYYGNKDSNSEVVDATESLYHNIMKWAQLPETWQLGDEQRIDNETDVAIHIKTDDKILTFRKASLNVENHIENESWCVLKYNSKTNKQERVESDMDKASAIMSAKRLSDNDKESFYTAAIVQDVTERRTDITPFKVYKDKETVGKVVKNLK